MIFQKFDGESIPDISKYVIEWVKDKGPCEIHVGTDSQVKSKTITYVTVVCIWEIGKGVHIVYKKDNIESYIKMLPFKMNDRRRRGSKRPKPKEDDMIRRLWGEVERTKEAADILARSILEFGLHTDLKIKVHLDINPNPIHGSNKAYDMGVSQFDTTRFGIYTKPQAWAASHAADMLVR